MFSTRVSILAAALLALCAGPARALTQEEALAEAAAVNRSGSDESLQNSTTSAMRAMLELNNQNRPGAVKNGYQAFGEYRTSQDLDIVRMENRIRQIDLFTNNVKIGTPVPKWARSRENYHTTFARLDPKFLRQGEAGKVADEFERKSGMRRETFLKKLAQVSESTISANDPNLTSKVLGKFSAFVEDIPNPEFRENVRKQIDATSPSSQAKLIKDGAKHIWDVLSSYGVSVAPKAAALRPPGAEDERAPASVSGASPAAFTGAGPAPGRPESAVVSTKHAFFQEMAPQDADLKSLNLANDPVGSAMQAALNEQGEMTIFKQVSKRYRAVTPLLSVVKP